jgi:glutaminyl-tRNA synthetase
MDDAPNKFKGFTVGREVRLRGAYLATCDSVEKDDAGNVTLLRCTYDPESRGGSAPDGRKVRSTIHWVSAKHAVDAEVRLYDRLYTVENPLADKEKDFKDFINPDSLQVVNGKLEPMLANAEPGARFQFERVGYFCADLDHTPGQPVFNRTITLRAPKRI